MKQAQRLITIDEPDDSSLEEDLDYEPFRSEKTYTSPEEVEAAVTDRIQQLSLRLATVEVTY